MIFATFYINILQKNVCEKLDKSENSIWKTMFLN